MKRIGALAAAGALAVVVISAGAAEEPDSIGTAGISGTTTSPSNPEQDRAEPAAEDASVAVADGDARRGIELPGPGESVPDAVPPAPDATGPVPAPEDETAQAPPVTTSAAPGPSSSTTTQVAGQPSIPPIEVDREEIDRLLSGIEDLLAGLDDSMNQGDDLP